MTSLKFVFVFGVLAVNLRYTRAISENDVNKIKEAFMPFVSQCEEKLKLSNFDVQAMKESPGYIDPCFMECLFKKTKVINDEGLFDTDKAAEMIKTNLSDKNDQNNALDIIHFCKRVNDRKVTDGDKDCERAIFLFQCLIPPNKMLID